MKNDNKACAKYAPGVYLHAHTFELTGKDATEARCKVMCSTDKNCIAMSGVWRSKDTTDNRCRGCSVALEEDVNHDNSLLKGAKAYIKENTGMNEENWIMSNRICFITFFLMNQFRT